MLRTLLLPLDGSAFAEQALPLALSIGRRAKASLDLLRVHVVYALTNPGAACLRYDPAEDAEARKGEFGYLEAVVRRIGRAQPLGMTCAVVDGFVADAILGRAKGNAADLIVMTTHGRGPVSRALLGSVADELVRRSPIPVLLIRPQAALPDLEREPCLGRILVPLDGSPASEQILGPAMELAAALGTACTFFHVVHPDTQSAARTGSDWAAGLKWSCQKQDAEEALAYLDSLAKRFRTNAMEIRTRVMTKAHAPLAIMEEARTQCCGLIALATHGRGGFKRLFLGSVADKVLRGASCPVLVYRGTEK